MKLRVFSILLVLITFSTSCIATQTERRIAISLGSGKIRYVIADVNSRTDQVINTLDSGAFDTAFHIDLQLSSDRQFSPTMFERTLEVFERIKDKYNYYGVTRFKAIARQSFRDATNARELADSILKHTGFAINIVPPSEEDQLDYFTALQVSQKTDRPVVWDIGTNRFQLIMKNEEGETFTHKGNFGSMNFMDYLLEVVQRKKANTSRFLHPLTEQEAKAGLDFARFLARQTPSSIKKAIVNSNGYVLAIGSMFRYSISGDIAGKKGVIDKKILHHHIQQWLSTEDHTMHKNSNKGNPDAFSHINLANAILVYGFMEELGIEKLNISNQSLTESILEYTPYWH